MTVPGHLVAAALWFARRAAKRRMIGAVTVARAPRGALVALAISAATLLVTAALGPSAAVEPLPGRPPFGWHADPSAGLVTALLAVTVLAGGYGTLGCLAALRRGWVFDVKRLLLAGTLVAAALAILAPVGSSDPGSYVSYGRLAATSHDPYTTPPSALTDSYRGIAEAPWQTTTSVYGPIATAEQWLAATVAGDGPEAPAHAVFLLGVINALAFLATGLLLQRLAPGQAGRRRAAVLFSANPLLLFEGVAGAHVDVLLTFFVVAAIAALRARGWLGVLGAFVAGVLGGAAAGVKASAALAGAGFAWALHQGPSARSPDRRPPIGRVITLGVGAAAVLVPGYLLAGPHAFDQLRHASGFVSFADPWRIVTHPLEAGLGYDGARVAIRVAAWLAFAVFVVMLYRGLPGGSAPGVRANNPARAALVLVLAWLLTAPYVLPWYAVVGFALLAVLPASGFDRILIFWTSVLALAYLPGRQVALPPWLHHTIDAWKSACAPVLLLGTAAIAAALCLRRRQHFP